MSSKFAVIWSISILLILWIFVQMRLLSTWFSNDDTGMMMICSGIGFSHSPDPHILFTNILLGVALSHLYQCFPHYPWYGIYIISANILALVVMSTALLIGRSKVLGLASVFVLCASVGLRCLCVVQFTSTACMVAIGGVASLITWWELKESSNSVTPSKFWLILASVLFILSSLIRFDSFLLVGILSCLLFLFRQVLSLELTFGEKFRSLRIPVIILVSAVLTGLSFQQINNYEYSKVPGWSEYYVANRLHANFVDFSLGRNSNIDQDALLKTAADWTPNDFRVVERFFFFDDKIFSISKMRAISLALWSRHFKPIPDALPALLKVASDPILLPVFIAFFLLFVVYRGSELKIHKALMLLVSLLMLMMALIIGFKLPQPVYFPIFIFFLFVLLFYFNRNQKFPLAVDTWKFKAMLAVVSIIVAGLFAYSYELCRVRARIGKENNRVFRQTVQTFKNIGNAKNLYVVWGDLIRYEYMLPLDDTSRYMTNIDILPLVFRANQPLAATMMAAHGLSLEKFDKGLTLPNVYIIGVPETNNMLATYIKEHYDAELTFRLVKSVPEMNMDVYQCKSSAAN